MSKIVSLEIESLAEVTGGNRRCSRNNNFYGSAASAWASPGSAGAWGFAGRPSWSPWFSRGGGMQYGSFNGFGRGGPRSRWDRR